MNTTLTITSEGGEARPTVKKPTFLRRAFTQTIRAAGIAISTAAASAQTTLWEFDNFRAYGYIYNRVAVNPQRTKAAPNEIGSWKGRDLSVSFEVPVSQLPTEEELIFSINTVYIGEQRPVFRLYAGRGTSMRNLGVIDLSENSEFSVPRGLFKEGRGNRIVLHSGAKVGYGQPSGTVIDYISLTTGRMQYDRPVFAPPSTLTTESVVGWDKMDYARAQYLLTFSVPGNPSKVLRIPRTHTTTNVNLARYTRALNRLLALTPDRTLNIKLSAKETGKPPFESPEAAVSFE